MAEIEDKALEFKSKLEGYETSITELKAKLEAAETKLAELEKKEVKDNSEEVAQIKADMEKLNEALNEINKKKDKMEVKETLEGAFKQVFESAEFKNQFDSVMKGDRQSTRAFSIELKTDPTSVVTGGMTGDVTRTYGGGISGALYEPNKFIAAMTNVPVPADKNRAMWYDGSYFANVGYMTELTGITTGDGASIEEKYRELAKVGAKLPFSREAATEMSYFVNWARTKGIESVLNKVDELIYSGVGADVTKPKEIYGLKTKGATAFNAATAGLALAIQDANIADVILAAVTQIKIQSKQMFIPDVAFVHPSNVALLRALKNKQADYINMLPNGSMMVHGVQIIESAKVGASEILVATSKTLQLHQMYGLEVEVERVASTDSYVMYLRWKGQVVVPTTDLLANVIVSNITTAIAAINAGPAVVYTQEVTTTTSTTTTTTTTTAG